MTIEALNAFKSASSHIPRGYLHYLLKTYLKLPTFISFSAPRHSGFLQHSTVCVPSLAGQSKYSSRLYFSYCNVKFEFVSILHFSEEWLSCR